MADQLRMSFDTSEGCRLQIALSAQRFVYTHAAVYKTFNLNTSAAALPSAACMRRLTKPLTLRTLWLDERSPQTYCAQRELTCQSRWPRSDRAQASAGTFDVR